MNEIITSDNAEALPATTALTDNAQMLAMIERMAINTAVDVAKLNALLDMQDRIMRRNAEIEANQAFARVCKAMPVIRKNGLIDFGKGGKPIPYAKWEHVQAIIKPIYEAENFVLNFDSKPLENGWSQWTAILTHANGHTFRASIALPLDTSGGKQNIQGAGSTASYGQRYSTKSLFNLQIEGEDDDGKLGATVFITDEQAATIRELLIETGADYKKFLEWMAVAEVETIQQKDYPRAINSLNKKKASKQ